MNRLASLAEELTVPSTGSTQTKRTNTHLLDGSGINAADCGPIVTFAPVHYEPRYAYPLLVWLHGQGGSGAELRQLMPLVSLRNYVAVAPHGVAAVGPSSPNIAWEQSADGIQTAAARVFESISTVVKRFHIHEDRIFIAGRGSGGTMAVRLAWDHPHRFRGAATIGGPLPAEMRPLRHLNQLRTLPLLVAAGRHSKAYSERRVCRDLRLLHVAGLTVALRQYPCADELRSTMFSDLDRWMMEMVCGTPMASMQ